MKVAIMQPYFFPYIGYFQLINAVDTFVVYDDVNFIKKGWINRNSILVNKQSFLFNIPLSSASQNNKICEIKISEDVNWKSNFLKTIQFSYKKAPFFDVVFPILNKIIHYEEEKLSNFILFSLEEICKYLLINTKFIISSEIHKDNSLKGQDKIIEICKKLKCESYINPIGGLELYNVDVFVANDLSLNFIKSNAIVYTQFKDDFIPWLSIIDVLMFNSVEQINEMLGDYELL